jgi:hypothetical protein
MARSPEEIMAETGPGIPDEAVLAGQLTPDALAAGADAAVEKLEQSGWVKPSAAEAEAETQAHPS